MADLTRRHLLLVPAPFYGLYIPMLELAKKAVKFHDITIMLMQSKLDDIKSRQLLPPEPIRWVPFRDNVAVEVGADITMASNAQLMAALGDVYRILIKCIPTRTSPPLAAHYDIDVDPVDVVIADRLFAYTVFEGCYNRNIPFYGCCFLPQTSALKLLTLTADSPVTADIYMDESEEAKETKKMYLEGIKFLQYSRGLLLNTFESLDNETGAVLKDVRSTFSPPVWFVGPILNTEKEKKSALGDWLDKQAPVSVVYFSFGSVLSATPEQIAEISTALTNLKRPFIWSLHKDAVLPSNLARSSLEKVDPESSYLILSWLDQKKVLRHPSVAVFVSHCGYNSVLEAAYYGVPIAAWPLFGDEHLNAKFVESKGFGKALEGTDLQHGRTVPSGEIEEALAGVAGWSEVGDPQKYRQGAHMLQASIREATGPEGPSSKSFLRLMQDISTLNKIETSF